MIKEETEKVDKNINRKRKERAKDQQEIKIKISTALSQGGAQS